MSEEKPEEKSAQTENVAEKPSPATANMNPADLPVTKPTGPKEGKNFA